MGDLKTLAKARMELEELYSGIPDDSVNLTFQDLAIHVKQSKNSPPEKINTSTTTKEPIQEATTPKQASPLTKLPSLDFNRGLQASKNHQQPRHLAEGHPLGQSHKHNLQHDDTHSPCGNIGSDHHDQSNHGHANIGRKGPSKSRFAPERSREFDDVCGRVHCRNCVSIGMGEMTGGRKCIDCLGRRFSQRYVSRAGMVGCCSGYPSDVKQAELRWAEKGPRRAGERAFGHGNMISRSRNPMTPPRPSNKAGERAFGHGNMTSRSRNPIDSSKALQ
ncbi:hypothetical protein POTOM_059725 [Populus tomentosa]|uniref:Uncharacterized protein n=1 Tax=Populus tomentosa TaxID=118781 RepID=A0A8X7XQE1_POPTO|nr:hypothetical protein POTOM_059725 [Populus tomentosa]